MITVANVLSKHFSSSTELSPQVTREVSRSLERAEGSALTRAYQVEMESRVAGCKVTALSSVARTAMSEVAFVHSIEDTLVKSLHGTAVGSVAIDRLDLISREYAIAAGDLVLRTARRMADM